MKLSLARLPLEITAGFYPGVWVQHAVADLVAARQQSQARGFALGASGGIDSLVTAVLCLGAARKTRTRVWCLQMNDARIKGEHYNADLYRQLGAELVEIDLTREAAMAAKRLRLPSRRRAVLATKLVLRCLPARLKQWIICSLVNGTAPGWAQTHLRVLTLPHRLRLAKLQEYARQHQALVVICANRTEAELGYFVEYGVDDCRLGDLAPLRRCYKTQVYLVAHYLGLPAKVLHQRPSPGFGGIGDEEILGPYDLVDLILAGIHAGWNDAAIYQALRQQLAAKKKKGQILRRGGSSDYLFNQLRFIRKLHAAAAGKAASWRQGSKRIS